MSWPIIRLRPEIVNFFREFNLGYVGDQPLNSQLISLQEEYNGVPNPMYGIFRSPLLHKLVRKYFQYAPKTPEGYLIRTPQWNEAFHDVVRDAFYAEIDHEIPLALRRSMGDRVMQLSRLRNNFENVYNNPQPIIPNDIFNPSKINSGRFETIIYRSKLDLNSSLVGSDVRRVFGQSPDEVLRTEEALVDTSTEIEPLPLKPQLRYQEISLQQLGSVLSSGQVARFGPSSELQHLTQTPNQVFLIYVVSSSIPYMVIARLDPTTNQLFPPA